MLIPFATQSYSHDSLPISAQRAVNCYAEQQPQNAKTPVSVHGHPGITTFATAGAGPIRGYIMLDGLLYAVSGPWLYSITNDATPVATQLGGQIAGSGVVSLADNGTQIMMVDGTNGFTYSVADGFDLVTDADFNAAKTTAHMDGFFLFDEDGTARVFRSDSLDGTSYSALAFATKESKSDFVQAVVNVKQVLYVLGEKSSELWANSGAANFPFQRLPGGTIDRGILAPHARAQEDQALFLLGDDRVAYRMSGVQLQRISTHAIEQAWQKYTAVSDAFGLAYTWNGHKFAVLTFPTQEAALGSSTSWSFDIAAGHLPHERLSYDASGNPLGRWRGNCAIEAYGKVLIGDAFSGKIGYLDPTVHTEFGDPMHVSMTSPPYHAGDKALFHSDLTIDMEAGVGLSSGQGSDPQIMLDISDDGGRTFGPMQPWAAMGAMGAYKTWVRWQRLGRTERGGTRVYRVTISDPVKRTIIAAHSNMKPGM